MEPPPGDATNPDIARDEIINSYIKTLAKVVGSEEEARQKIYSVSTRHYFAFGAVLSEELSYRLKELPKVRWVLADSYVDVKNKDYGGEPFINGEAVPYDPKYHEEWVRNNARHSHHGGGNIGYPGSGNIGYPGSGPGYQGQGSDSDDQGKGSDSDDGSHSNNESDSDDQGEGSDSDVSNNISESLTTKAKEATETTNAQEIGIHDFA